MRGAFTISCLLGEMSERAALVAIIRKNETEAKATEYLNELEALTHTLGWRAEKRFYQRLHTEHPRTCLGTGKLEEIRHYVREAGVKIVVFDDELSPTHLRNVQAALKTLVYDRSSVILEIFKTRARTMQAKCQVQLARSQYLLPRLTRMWSHLERQRGNIATRGGSGEKEIETDRRQIRHEIGVLKRRLQRIKTQGRTQRKRRTHMMRVALVGYTNVGKSTLMHALTHADVVREDKPFATLDTTVRRMKCGGVPVLLSDTIGFIRKLPHELIESFESTLEEVKEADLLLHVVDFSSPCMEEHADTVHRTLKNLRVEKKPTVLIFNKIDKVPVDPLLHETNEKEGEAPCVAITPHERSAALCARYAPTQVVYTSMAERKGLEELRALIHKRALENKKFAHSTGMFQHGRDLPAAP